jgi:HlyD family secretion protein
MKSNGLFIGFWILLIAIVVVLATKFQDRDKGMIAQVENNVTAVSYETAVRIKAVHVVPGQQVDYGNLLLEVDLPEVISEIRRLETEKRRLEVKLKETTRQYFTDLGNTVNAAQSSGSTSKTRTANRQLVRQLARDTALPNDQVRTIDLLLRDLNQQASYRIAIAEFSGIIGSVHAQLDELVPPYTTVLTIYESQPTIIKAYLSERTANRSLIGQKVNVESYNRTYSISGRITEIGKRIVPYPSMIDPSLNGSQSYGQEIFIEIPDDNDFLNGEKVYVFLIKED